MNRITYSLAVIICAMCTIEGCRKDLPVGDRGSSVAGDKYADEVRFLTRMKWTDPQMAAHRQEAMANITNGVLDPRPILLFAKLVRPVGTEHIYLVLIVVDEDRDLLGIGIRETTRDKKGSPVTCVEERYPVFIHLELWHILDTIQVPVVLRKNDERKDETLWREYATREIESIPLTRWEYYSEALPTLWVTPPEPNSVDVQIYLYDRAGHESEPLPLFSGLSH